MHVIVLVAAMLSFIMAIGLFRWLINPVSFLVLWMSYQSVNCLGHEFMQQQ